jgi:hypothetical protein
MPERNERFFWLYTRQFDYTVVSAIHDLHQRFVAEGKECSLERVACVEDRSPSD